MPVARDMIGVKGDECDCGRRQTVRHCISCGSTRLYARQNRYHKMLDGSIQQVAIQFRCQGCGHEFIEEERQFCEAPPVGQTLAKLKVQRLAEASARGEFLRPEDEKMAGIIDKLVGSKPKVTPLPVIPEAEALLADSPIDAGPAPEGLNREEYDFAQRAFRLEWANKKIMGQDPGISVDEYVARKLKGEVFE